VRPSLVAFSRVLFAIAAAGVLPLGGCSSSVSDPNPSSTPPPVGDWQIAASVRVKNNSSRCAWFTIYSATFATPYKIADAPTSRPRFIQPHESYTFIPVIIPQPGIVVVPGEIKVLAEIQNNAQGGCNGGEWGRRSEENKGLLPVPKSNANYMFVCSSLEEADGRWWIQTPRAVAKLDDCQ
jgi:hypothetical protein